jgi:hypothetical protein
MYSPLSVCNKDKNCPDELDAGVGGSSLLGSSGDTWRPAICTNFSTGILTLCGYLVFVFLRLYLSLKFALTTCNPIQTSYSDASKSAAAAAVEASCAIAGLRKMPSSTFVSADGRRIRVLIPTQILR